MNKMQLIPITWMDFGIPRGKQKHKVAFQLAIHIKFLKQANRMMYIKMYAY